MPSVRVTGKIVDIILGCFGVVPPSVGFSIICFSRGRGAIRPRVRTLNNEICGVGPPSTGKVLGRRVDHFFTTRGGR